MDFHALPRRDLQALAKRNGIRANMTNGAMADALAALIPAVDGIEEYVQQQPVAEPTPPVVQATAEEEEEKEAPAAEKQENEVIVLDDSEEEKDLTTDEDEQKAPALGVGRRRVAWAEPIAATATRKRAAARKADTAEAVPARATRARSQSTVESAAEEEAPKTRRTSRRAAGRKAGTQQQEEEENATQGDVSEMEATMAAPVEEQSQEDEGETEKEAVAAEAVRARATRGRRQRTAMSVAEEDAPKTRRTSRRAVAKKNSTEQEDEEKATQGDASDMEVAVPAPVSSDDGGDGAEEMEEAMDAQNEEQNASVEEQSQEDEGETEKEVAAAEAVPARATRARSQRTAVLAPAEEAPKARRATRRAVATKTATEQDEEEKGAQESGDVPDMRAAVPADEGGHDAEEKEAAMDAQNEEFAAAEAVPVRTTRTRRQRTVAPVVEDEAPKARRTSRRASRRETGMQQEEEEKGTHGDVADEVAAVTAPVSSDDGGEGAEEMEAVIGAQNEEQSAAAEADTGNAAAETVPARTTRARSQRTVVSTAEEEAPKGRRTSRRAAARKTDMEQEEEEKREQCDSSDVDAAVPAPVNSEEGTEEMDAAMDAQNEEQNKPVEEPIQEDEGETGRSLDCSSNLRTPMSAVKAETPTARGTSRRSGAMQQQGIVSDVETAVPAPASSDEEGDGAQEIEASMDAETEEQNAAVETQNQQDEGVVAEIQASVADSSVEEQTETASSEEIQHSCEDTEMVPVEEVPQPTPKTGVATEEVDCTAEEEPPVEEDVDSSADEEPPVAEDVDSLVQEPLVDVQQCEATVKEVLQATMTSGEATKDIGFTSDVEHASEENEDYKAEEELPVAEDDQQCEAAEEIQLASEDTEMVPVNEVLQGMRESGEATEEVDCTSDVDEENEEFEEDAEMVPVNEVLQAMQESGEATEEVDCTSDVDEENEEFEEEPTLAEHVEPSVQEPLVDVQQCEATEEIQLDISMAAESLMSVAEVVTIDYLSQATITDDEVKESGFTADLTDLSIIEEAAVAADEMPLSLAGMEEEYKEEVATIDYPSQATVTDDEGAVKESGFSCDFTDVFVEEMGVVAAEGMTQSSTTEQKPEEVVAVDIQSQATVTDDEGAVKEGGFTGELTDVSIEEQGVVAVDEMLHSSATMEGDVEKVVSVDNLSQATVAVESLVTVEQATVTDDEWAVKESTAAGGRTPLVYTAREFTDFMTSPLSASVMESAVAGGRTPVVATARNFTDHIASPWSANVFEYATKSLSINSVTEKPMASEPADVPLCMYSSSGGKKDATEPVAVQRENEVKEGKEPEAAIGKIIYSPLTIRKLRRAVAEENEADGVPPCIFISSSGGEENSAEPVLVEREKEVNEPEAAFGKPIYSPLTIRKLRRAVAEENEADSVPPCIFISSSGGEENSSEPALVEREKEVNAHETLGSLSLRKLRTEFNQIVAVAQENEVKEGEKSSLPLDKLSLRKLRTKLKETLNAHKNMEPKRVPLGRLDENAC